MLATQGISHSPTNNRGGRGSDRHQALGKIAANAFMKKRDNEESDSDEDSGNILDQRRINEIFVRLKVAEISSLNFAVLGIL